ncbi:MAG: hypothetical protein U1D67_09870 [Dehalococcoidia bacterium]|nr:hypothetical protein [Dehalococcoidia bacterium]
MPKVPMVIALLLIIAVVVIAVNRTNGNKGKPGNTVIPTPSPAVVTATPSSPTPLPLPSPARTEEPGFTGTPVPTVTKVPATPPVPAPTQPGNVKFSIDISAITGSGFSRNVTARVANTGSADAHGVWGKVEVMSQGSRVKLNGQDFLRTDIGTLKAGETATREIAISFSLSDGLKMAQGGADFVLTIISDENTETYLYKYTP